MTIGDNIKYFRKQSNLTQVELAEKIGVSNRTVCSWEINRTEPDMDSVDKICTVLGCTRNNLVSGPDNSYIIPDMAPDIALLIDLYNRANPEQRQAVINLLRSFV